MSEQSEKNVDKNSSSIAAVPVAERKGLFSFLNFKKKPTEEKEDDSTSTAREELNNFKGVPVLGGLPWKTQYVICASVLSLSLCGLIWLSLNGKNPGSETLRVQVASQYIGEQAYADQIIDIQKAKNTLDTVGHIPDAISEEWKAFHTASINWLDSEEKIRPYKEQADIAANILEQANAQIATSWNGITAESNSQTVEALDLAKMSGLFNGISVGLRAWVAKDMAFNRSMESSVGGVNNFFRDYRNSPQATINSNLNKAWRAASASWGKSSNILTALVSDEAKTILENRRKNKQDLIFAQNQLNKSLIGVKSSSSKTGVWICGVLSLCALSGLLIVGMRQNRWQKLHEQAKEDEIRQEINDLESDLAALLQGDLTQKIRVAEGALKEPTETLNEAIENLKNVFKEVRTQAKESYELTMSISEVLTRMVSNQRMNIDESERQSGQIFEVYESASKINQNIQKFDYFLNEFKDVLNSGSDSSSEIVEKMFNSKNRLKETDDRLQRIQSFALDLESTANGNVEMGEQLWILGIQTGVFAAKSGEGGQGFRVISENLTELAKTVQEQAGRSLNSVENIKSDLVALAAAIKSVEKEMQSAMDITDKSQTSWRDVLKSSAHIVDSVGELKNEIVEQNNVVSDLEKTNRHKLSSTNATQDVLQETEASLKKLVEKQRELKESVSSKVKV